MNALTFQTNLSQQENDCKTVEAFQSTGDNHYFGIIYQRYQTMVFECCHDILRDRNQAQDLTQDIMLTVLDKLGQLRDGRLLSFWIYRIAKNEALRAARRNALYRTVDIDTKINCAGEPTMETAALEYELYLASVCRLMRQLNPLDRKMLELKYFKEASIRDLERQTGLSTSAVKMRLMRARGQMLNLFQRNGLQTANFA